MKDAPSSSGDSFRLDPVIEARLCEQAAAFERRIGAAFAEALGAVKDELQENRQKLDELDATVRSIRAAIEKSIDTFQQVLDDGGPSGVIDGSTGASPDTQRG